MTASFDHSLSEAFLDALDRLVEASDGQWWRDVLAHPDLILAIRGEYLNVYHRGASIFRVSRKGETLVPETHIKYLVRQRQGYVTLQADGSFGGTPDDAIWRAYGKGTLGEMIKAAQTLAGAEKTGVHALVRGNPHVVDVEVAFSTSGSPSDGPGEDALTQTAAGMDRLDAAVLEERKAELWVAFHEAKHFANQELRAGEGSVPPVLQQLERYARTIEREADAIATSYQKVCHAFVRIDGMRRRLGIDRSLSPLITQAADRSTPLKVHPKPRLIVFGFDRDQRDGPIWQAHQARLKASDFLVTAIGSPKGATRAFA